jgi:hypothetical protein
LKKALGLALFLVLVISGMSMVVSSGSLPSRQDSLYYECSVTATITNDGIQVQTEYTGPDSLRYNVTAVFIPSYDLVDSDSQSAYGLGGEIHCYVDGFYNYGDSHYRAERHLVTASLTPFTTLYGTEVTCIGDNIYEDTYSGIPPGYIYHYEDIYTVCSTHIECSVYWSIFYIGDVYLTAVIYGP